MKKILKNKWFILFVIVISYLAIDITYRYFIIKNYYYYSIRNIAPILFDFAIISFNILVIKVLPKILGIIYYIISSLFCLIMGLVHYFHYKILGTIFTFSELFLAGEGLDFINSIKPYIELKIILPTILVLLLIIFGVIVLIKEEKNKINKKNILLFLGITILTEILGIVSLNVFDGGYDRKNSPYYNFKKFNVGYKAIQVSGVLQYNIQDVYIYYYNQYLDAKNMRQNYEELVEVMSKKKSAEKNELTDIFKDKNLIYVMLESIDDWLITEETTPTLYKMQQEGWNFTNRYAPQFFSGYTFGSEFSANTGLYLMDNYDKYNDNTFTYALPNLFKQKGYKTNSYHMNLSTFYDRDKFHKQFGYEEYYGGYYRTEEYKEDGFLYINDVDWIDNEETYDLLVDKDNKFMSFLITYSAHLPYSKNQLEEFYDFNKKITFENSLEEQLYCIKYQAKMTDDMFKKLLSNLKRDNLIDDTVIIVFTDHYAYGFTETDYIREQKGVKEDSLLQKTPLIIWSNDIEHMDIDTLMDTADLVPTISNLFGLKYDSKKYLSTDVFSKDHEEFVYFNNNTYLDANNELHQNTDEINNIIKYNKNILKTDYYAKSN